MQQEIMKFTKIFIYMPKFTENIFLQTILDNVSFQLFIELHQTFDRNRKMTCHLLKINFLLNSRVDLYSRFALLTMVSE